MTRILLGALVVCLSVSARADELVLEDVLRSTERALPLLLAAQQERVLADAEVQAAAGAWDPTLRIRGAMTPEGYYPSYRFDAMIEQPTPLWGASLFAGYRLGLGKFADYDGKLATNDGGEVRAGINLPILRNGWTDRRRINVDKARLGVPLAQATIRAAQIDATRAATIRYWEWVAAGRRVEVASALLALAEDRASAIDARIGQGDLAAIDRADNQRTVEQRRGQLAVARRALELAAIELSLFLRDDALQPQLPGDDRLPRQLPEPTVDDPAAELAEAEASAVQRPDVRRTGLLREQHLLEQKLAFNQVFPILDVGVAVSQDFGEGSPTRKKLEVDAFIYLEVPLALRSARGRLTAAQAMVRRTEQLLRAQRDRARADVRDAASALRAAQRRIGAARTEVDLAVRLEEAERARYQLGDSNLIYVNLREQTTAEARLREIEALLDYQRGKASWTAATAR